MIFFVRLLTLLFKIVVITAAIGFERVIGLPIFFCAITTAFLLTSRQMSKYSLLVISGLLLALFYEQSLVFSLLVVSLLYLSFVYGAKLLESNVQRFLLVLLGAVVVIGIASGIEFTFWTGAQLVVSLGIVSIGLVKFLFTTYGFLGRK